MDSVSGQIRPESCVSIIQKRKPGDSLPWMTQNMQLLKKAVPTFINMVFFFCITDTHDSGLIWPDTLSILRIQGYLCLWGLKLEKMTSYSFSWYFSVAMKADDSMWRFSSSLCNKTSKINPHYQELVFSATANHWKGYPVKLLVVT